MNLEERLNNRIDICEKILREDINSIRDIVNNKIIIGPIVDIKYEDYIELEQKIQELKIVSYTRYILSEKIKNNIKND